jgi:hypothetical protein
MTDSRRKGQSAMNQVCRAFTHWLFPDTPRKVSIYDIPFRVRSTSIMPLDGHWEGKGDILHRPDIVFPFCTEVKKHEGWTLDAIFRPKSPIWKWWKQCTEQADACSGIPLLVFMRNRQEPYAMLPKTHAVKIGIPSLAATHLTVSHNQQDLSICLLNDLTEIDPEKLSGLEA